MPDRKRLEKEKLLLVGSDSADAIENFFHRHLVEAGMPVVVYPAHRLFYDHHASGLLARVSLKLGLSGVYKRINKEFLDIVEHERPTVILAFKGMELFPESLKKAKALGARLVNYNPDHPFRFHGPGSGNENVLAGEPLYDLHLTYSDGIMQDMIARGRNIARIPFGFDLDDAVYEKVRTSPEIERVCFIGNPDAERARVLASVAERMPLDVHGNGWQGLLSGKDIRVHPPVTGIDFWTNMHRYRVQLNMLRPHNKGSHNMRTFEIPGAGGIQLATRTAEHEALFEEGTEIFLFSDNDEMLAQAQELLAMGKERAAEVRERARGRCVRSGYHYRDRVSQLLGILYD